MRRTSTGTTRRAARACAVIALPALLMLAAGDMLTAQTTTSSSSIQQQVRRTLDSLRSAKPGTAADSALRDQLVATLSGLPMDSSAALRLQLVRPTRGPVRGAFKGHTVALELSRPIGNDTPYVSILPVDSLGRSTGGAIPLPVYAIKDTLLYTRIPDTISSGRYEVTLSVLDGGTRTNLQYPQPLAVQSIWYAIGMAALPLGVLILLIVIVGLQKRTALNPSIPPTQTQESIVRMFLVDPRNNCLSLSRLQFLIWTVIIAFSYCFMFCARVIAENVWTFPPLDGFATTFFISLGTLLGSEATTQVKGAMGANAMKPRISDLFMHGGVVAPERVQQILWTIISAAIFVLTVVNNYAITTTIPEIPSELLVLMGISSAGYLTGKMIRKPGPVLTDVLPDAVGNTLTIKGENIQNDAQMYVDGVKLGTPVVEPDPDKPDEMAESATYTLPDDPALRSKVLQGKAMIWVINKDGQRAQWQTPKPGTVAPAPGDVPAAPAAPIPPQTPQGSDVPPAGVNAQSSSDVQPGGNAAPAANPDVDPDANPGRPPGQ